jgi:enolase
MNILNGGKHADNIDLQEFMIFPGRRQMLCRRSAHGVETFHQLKGVLKKRLNTSVAMKADSPPICVPMKKPSKLFWNRR